MQLLTAQKIDGHRHIITGQSNLAFSRAQRSLECGAQPIYVGTQLPEALKDLVKTGKVEHVDESFQFRHVTSLGRDEVSGVVDQVLVVGVHQHEEVDLGSLYRQCLSLRVPLNVAGHPEYCSFTFLASYADGDFQFGVTTSGKGCRLANRLKREMVAALPANVDEICNKIGSLRERIYEEDLKDVFEAEDIGQEDDDAEQKRLNVLVVEDSETFIQKKKQRLRWLSQLVEYFPLGKLANVSIDDLNRAYHSSQEADAKESQQNGQEDDSAPAVVDSSSSSSKAHIALIGSGPGSAQYLTSAALERINSADLILADKLVPESVLDLIPRATEVFIAKKYPGNAEAAQTELLERGLDGLKQGKMVVRLKQGDPYIYGRGGEEYIFFAGHGYKPEVVPGITSALSAPLAANIPPTHRDVADQVLICTGTGRKGAMPVIPEFVKSRTVIFLMALHRVDRLMEAISATPGWDLSTPCAVIERASCHDQRVTRTTLQYLVEAVEAIGSRPPGLLVVGHSCTILEKLDEGQKWKIEEGYHTGVGETLKGFSALA
ncbi:tetrapyrrole methylase [Yarrowia lipolytica]|uniref:uroporphyrinogen-III C-methyltransferase n=2 Tax=Yarrowia lipolytica TaxID=4952 RepID=Q6CI67_YARLI|nr:YALI0A01133p [Yarrowia lipolytica CLIB122]RDW22756.1 tetrapyrrole methylase [Yarrowia lipolytica]RDW35369.1 tetrapyrrole methylase [Yarrowia lipolytica]RDW43921.1 tetrapyrrole methylase [Yarrowia lipolytica]RDW50606.1 tetrapyrrole methylase [Yarrowia lipolytica]CAG83564.1 YALI0A01133p [Yarrowia lipolytica CLIB122]|eukprot:XP_499644.1 YALI0A01133p [Yarrowia lipolytica CLIB122]